MKKQAEKNLAAIREQVNTDIEKTRRIKIGFLPGRFKDSSRQVLCLVESRSGFICRAIELQDCSNRAENSYLQFLDHSLILNLFCR